MRRRIVVLALALAAAPALAAELPSGAGRYTLGPSTDGFVRLDTRTGAASHCSVKDGVWHCEPLPQEDATLKAKVDALSANVTRLSAAVAALDDRVASLAAVGPPPPPSAARPPNLAQVLVGHLLDMVRHLKHGAQPDATPPAS